MIDLILYLLLMNRRQPFLDDGCVVRTTPCTGGHRISKYQSFTASALNYDTLWAPAVDHAERHFLGLVIPLHALDDLYVFGLTVLPDTLCHQRHSPPPVKKVPFSVWRGILPRTDGYKTCARAAFSTLVPFCVAFY